MPCSLRILCALLLALSLAVLAPPAAAQDGNRADPRPAEYMIYQYPDVALVVIVDAREVEFTVQVTDPEGAVITEAGVEGRRIGPVWLYVDSNDRPRQLMVRVRPVRPVERDVIGMELMQLSLGDPNVRRQAQAYRLLAQGMQRIYADSPAAWAQHGQSLRSAARSFAALGMERMRLWAEFYAAHLALHRLDDVVSCLELSAGIRRAARRAGFEDIALVNDVLESEALLRGAEKSGDAGAAEWYGRAHAALQALADRAGAAGYPVEQGLALYRDGAAHERQGDLARAIERYEQAIGITSRTADRPLLNRIRATAAAAYEAQGRTSGAIGLLEDIAGDLPKAASADADRAGTLYEKGRLLDETFRYAEAAATLEQALRLQQNDPALSQWGRTGLALGLALYETGELAEARQALLEGLPRSAGVESDLLVRAYDALAHIARFERRWEDMAAWRERQAAQPGRSRAAQAFEEGLDRVAREGRADRDALRLFERARDLAAAGGETRLRDRAGLQLCLHRLALGGDCDPARAGSMRDDLLRSGSPRAAADARLAHAKILRRLGRADAAEREVEALLVDIRFYRERLSGVLGAWDWANGEDVYGDHVAFALRRAPPGEGDDVLLALEQVRMLEQAAPGPQANEDLRNRIAAAEARADGSPGARATSEEIRARRDRYALESAFPDRAYLDAMLAHLERGEVLLSWHVAERQAYLLAADRRGVRLHRLGSSAVLQQDLDSLRQALSGADRVAPAGLLDRLGSGLVGPAAGMLDARVYLLIQGALAGIPVDALRLDGRFLAERSDIVQLASLASLQRRRPVLPADFGDRVFLAGNPQSGRDLFQYEIARSGEIDAVRDRFVGPGLHIVQGVALDRGEFDDARWSGAALLHLAIPGRIDLFDPDRSRLQLSEAQSFLQAPDLRSRPLAASLAVLSGTAFEGRARNRFDGRIGLVSDLHDAGVGAVAASLWPAGDALNAGLMAGFYDRLQRSGDVVEAFAGERRARIDRANPTNLRPWAGFQLFIR